MSLLNKVYKNRIVKGLICAATAIAIFAGSCISSYAEVTEESIKAKEAQISEAKKERDSLSTAKTNLEKIKKDLEKSKSDLNAYITELDASLTDIQTKIEQEQYDDMKKRIKFMYERGDTMYMELLVESGSFGDMLNKAEYIEMLSSYDRKKLNEYIATTQLITVTKQALEEEKATLDLAMEEKEQEEANLQSLLSTKSSELSAVKADISNKEAAIAEYEAEIKAENATIAALEKEVAADKAALYSRYMYDGGVFTWPCPSYTRISDNFGMRMHPTLGVEKMHNGIDLAAPAGSAILAAYNGTVVAADYNSSMGNYIMINHGGGLYTIYMHCSKLYVSKGTDVTAGTKIAAVGSTGRSTGNHLHFGVRLNGAYVSPWNYLK